MADEEQLDDFGETVHGFRELVGYYVEAWEDGYARLALDLTDAHRNRSGNLHGGVVMTVLDAAGGYAGTFCPVEGNVRRCVTLTLETHFMALADFGESGGGKLICEGRIQGGGKQIFFTQLEAKDAHGTVVAAGTGVYRLRSWSIPKEGRPLPEVDTPR